MKKIIVKNSPGKLPFLGILYDFEDVALREIVELPDDKYTLVVSEHYGYISLSLKNSDNKEVKLYKLVEYEPESFKLWRAYTHLGVNMGHCYMKNGGLCVARNKEGNYWLVKLRTIHCI